MKNALRMSIVSVALTAGLASAFASRAEAGVSFQGSFPLPHGSVSIAVGAPVFGVGAYVPVGYPVFAYPGYGYGFAYHDCFYPARRYGSRWVVYGSPYRYYAPRPVSGYYQHGQQGQHGHYDQHGRHYR